MTQIWLKGSLSDVHYQWTEIFTFSTSFLIAHEQFGRFFKYIIQYKYSNQQHNMNIQNTVSFFLKTCHNCPVCRVQMEIETQDKQRWPLEALYPHPPPRTRALAWQRDQVSALFLLGGLQYPQSLLPSTPSLLQWMVPKCQHVPPGLTQACPYWCGGGSMESTHPWR